jgi:hypothetical protein
MKRLLNFDRKSWLTPIPCPLSQPGERAVFSKNTHNYYSKPISKESLPEETSHQERKMLWSATKASLTTIIVPISQSIQGGSNV